MKQIFFTLILLALHVSLFADELDTLFQEKKYQDSQIDNPADLDN
jgi:hypothetical protein